MEECVFCQRKLTRSSCEINIFYCFNGRCKQHYVEYELSEDLSDPWMLIKLQVKYNGKRYWILYNNIFLQIFPRGRNGSWKELIINIELPLDNDGCFIPPITPYQYKDKLSKLLTFA